MPHPTAFYFLQIKPQLLNLSRNDQVRHLFPRINRVDLTLSDLLALPYLLQQFQSLQRSSRPQAPQPYGRLQYQISKPYAHCARINPECFPQWFGSRRTTHPVHIKFRLRSLQMAYAHGDNLLVIDTLLQIDHF